MTICHFLYNDIISLTLFLLPPIKKCERKRHATKKVYIIMITWLLNVQCLIEMLYHFLVLILMPCIQTFLQAFFWTLFCSFTLFLVELGIYSLIYILVSLVMEKKKRVNTRVRFTSYTLSLVYI